MATRVTIEEALPTHARFPPVTNLHRSIPVSPSGWETVNLTRTFGAMNTAYKMSATARLTSR